MRVYNLNSCINSFKFPDGQPHISFNDNRQSDRDDVYIKARIKNVDDLMNLFLLTDVIRNQNKNTNINVDFLYLIGTRMDRRISEAEPYTLRVICNLINAQKYNNIRVFWPHSQTVLDLLNGGTAERYLEKEKQFLHNSLSFIPIEPPLTLALPDQGMAKTWYNFYANEFRKEFKQVVECSKHREMSTGKLDGFIVNADTVNENVVIIDDLVDGGGTYVGLAKELCKKGAKYIHLITAHAILSKGPVLEGIDEIYTTASYFNKADFVAKYSEESCSHIVEVLHLD